MVDLHVHTKLSDGTDDEISILKKAQDRNLKYLSITDHDNCNIYDKFSEMNISDYYLGKIIPGVELRTIINGVPIELLGYGVDTNYINKKVKEMYISSAEKDRIETQRLYQNFINLGIDIEEDILENYDGSFRYGCSYLYSKLKRDVNNKRFILDERIWQDDTLFYRKCVSDPKSPFYIKSDDIIPNCDSVVKLIKDAGGLVFIPHIFIYGQNSMPILNNLISNHSIDGIECYYSHFTKQETTQIVDFCKQENLYMSGGSDYHGTNKPELELGVGKGDLRVPEEAVISWVKQLI